jgi:transcriptional regulator with XRE-family HTH domain
MQRGWVSSPAYKGLITALSTKRADLKISQRELARRLGKPPSFINKIELLERRVDIEEFIAISEAMDVNPGHLLNALRASVPDALLSGR